MVINKKFRRNARKPDQKREKSIRKRKNRQVFRWYRLESLFFIRLLLYFAVRSRISARRFGTAAGYLKPMNICFKI